MEDQVSLARVSKQHPCPICKKDSWCLVGDDIAICMRVQSERQHTFKDKTYGWMHKLNGAIIKRFVRQVERREIVDVGSIYGKLMAGPAVSLDGLAYNIGVSPKSLESLGCRWFPKHYAYAFPMFNGGLEVVGIRLRSISGDKWAVKGSRQGLFLPAPPPPKQVVVCEGPTDSAAALTIGLYPIGRPHCSGGVEEIKEFCKRNRVREMVIVSDNDEPGLRGASVLSDAVPISSCILIMPAKDMRSFVNAGGDKATFDALLGSVVWNRKT